MILNNSYKREMDKIVLDDYAKERIAKNVLKRIEESPSFKKKINIRRFSSAAAAVAAAVLFVLYKPFYKVYEDNMINASSVNDNIGERILENDEQDNINLSNSEKQDDKGNTESVSNRKSTVMSSDKNSNSSVTNTDKTLKSSKNTTVSSENAKNDSKKSKEDSSVNTPSAPKSSDAVQEIIPGFIEKEDRQIESGHYIKFSNGSNEIEVDISKQESKARSVSAQDEKINEEYNGIVYNASWVNGEKTYTVNIKNGISKQELEKIKSYLNNK